VVFSREAARWCTSWGRWGRDGLAAARSDVVVPLASGDCVRSEGTGRACNYLYYGLGSFCERRLLAKADEGSAIGHREIILG
jgi:hypothetical protein